MGVYRDFDDGRKKIAYENAMDAIANGYGKYMWNDCDVENTFGTEVADEIWMMASQDLRSSKFNKEVVQQEKIVDAANKLIKLIIEYDRKYKEKCDDKSFISNTIDMIIRRDHIFSVGQGKWNFLPCTPNINEIPMTKLRMAEILNSAFIWVSYLGCVDELSPTQVERMANSIKLTPEEWEYLDVDECIENALDVFKR